MSRMLDFMQHEYKFDCKLRFLLKEYSLHEIAKELLDWLERPDINYYDAATFARDIFLGSDLTKKEQGRYYNALKKQGYFNKLASFLYSSNIAVCSWAIYTFGKFSDNDNATFLEAAYETNYRNTNPMLAYRCLHSLKWLESKKLARYLKELKAAKTLTTRLILLYYWEPMNNNRAFKDLLKDEHFQSFVLPENASGTLKDQLMGPMVNFENHFWKLCHDAGHTEVISEDFERIARNYFATYKHI